VSLILPDLCRLLFVVVVVVQIRLMLYLLTHVLFAVTCNMLGMEMSKDGSCVLCPKGLYKDVRSEVSCSSCPYNKTTLTIGAKSVEDCVPGRLLVIIVFQMSQNLEAMYSETLRNTNFYKIETLEI